MTDEEKREAAKAVFGDLCAALDEKGWGYQKQESDLVIRTSFMTEDLPVRIRLAVDERRQLLRLSAFVLDRTPEERRMDMAVATCFASNRFVDGSFDFDYDDGEVTFRLTASFLGCRPGPALYAYLINVTVSTVDAYNDSLKALADGELTLEEFLIKFD